MIREMLASIRAFLARLPRFVMTKVWDGMRWVQRMVAVPAPPPPEPPPVTQGKAEDEDVKHMAALRSVAAHLAAGTVPPEAAIDALREEELSWLTAMEKPMLCRIATSSDDALRAHIKRTANLKGVLIFDPHAVAEYRAATRRRREQQDLEMGTEPVPALG